MVNDQGVQCIAAYKRLSKEANTAKGKIHRATAMREHHLHVCTSAICQSGASHKWEGVIFRMRHHCYDPERSEAATSEGALVARVQEMPQDGEEVQRG